MKEMDCETDILLECGKGNDFLDALELVDGVSTQVYPFGTPINITGFTIKMGVKVDYDDVAWIIDPVDIVVTILDAVNGKFTIKIPRNKTNIAPKDYVYDISIIDGANIKTTYLRGTFRIFATTGA
jgi:hypothetical protein